MRTRKFHRFIFADEALLARAALELKHWHMPDSSWWLGSEDRSLITRSSDVLDVITETFGFADPNTHSNQNYTYDRIERESKSNEQPTA